MFGKWMNEQLPLPSSEITIVLLEHSDELRMCCVMCLFYLFYNSAFCSCTWNVLLVCLMSDSPSYLDLPYIKLCRIQNDTGQDRFCHDGKF